MKIVSLTPVAASDREAVEAVAPDIRLVDAGGWFDGEFVDTWPPATVSRYVGGAGCGSRDERDALLADAEVVICGFPFPRDLHARAPRLRWLHQRPAGASNLRAGDIWGRDVPVTTSRGHGEVLAIAEYAISGFSYFAKGFDQAERDRREGVFDFRRYRITSLAGKTLCIIGAGGIGRAVGRLGSALGMQVIGTRRSAGTADDTLAADGFETIGGPETLPDQLARADFVAVCCQWTPETTHLLDASAFDAMRPGAVIANVARGEIIDESALLNALDSGHLRGAVLDVFVGEFDGPPPPALWRHPNVLLTPHTSNKTDYSRRGDMALFVDNLQRLRAGQALRYQIDWETGY
ncbi:MAG: D-2-hydroxyacid dehydrogenase [Pseudomonadota bacterium]